MAVPRAPVVREDAVRNRATRFLGVSVKASSKAKCDGRSCGICNVMRMAYRAAKTAASAAGNVL